jgi:hypothetical protein
MANETKWTPPKLLVKVRINPSAWAIESDDGGYACELLERDFMPGLAKRYADLFAASPELLEALEPDDRLNAGAIIHAGYQSKSSVETMHLLHCCLAAITDPKTVQHIKAEIERLMDRAEKALEKARGESPDAK